MYNLSEIAEDVYRISVFVPEFNLAFNHFLVNDDEPLLFHAGLRGMFPLLREAVAKVIDPASLRYIGFSHFESDECGALNHWLKDLASFQPQTLAIMHGSSYSGDGAKALTDLAGVLKEVLGPK